MVPILSLWLPIVLSAVIVFVLSSIVHTVLPHHRGDYRRLPAEDEVMAALRRYEVPPGDYMVPRPASMKEMRTPEFAAKIAAGPVFHATFWKPSGMAPMLLQWFAFLILVSVYAAYVTGRALGPGAHYLEVFRFAGATSFAGYALGYWPMSIWYRRSWGTTLSTRWTACSMPA